MCTDKPLWDDATVKNLVVARFSHDETCEGGTKGAGAMIIPPTLL